MWEAGTRVFAAETRDLSDAMGAVGHASLDWAGCALGGAPKAEL